MDGESPSDTEQDRAELAMWLSWFTIARWLVPFMLVPGSYAVHRLLGSEYHLPQIVAVTLASWVVNSLCARILTGYRRDVAANARRLRRLATIQTLADILLLVVAVHYAGGPMGPFWPFPFVPVIIGSALLPSLTSILLYGGFAITTTVLSAWLDGGVQVLAPLTLSMMLVCFGTLLTYTLARGLRRQRDMRRQLDRVVADKELAEAVARRREEILSVVSHELASPLMTLRGYVRLMQETKGQERGQPLLDRIERQVKRLSSLADDLLEMASTKTGALRLRRASFDLVEALHDLREASRLQFPDADISVSGEASVIGVWDRERLEQLFGNLVSNAVKFGGARCRIAFDVKPHSSREVHVTVTDNGPGISADALRRIFEPFQRYSSERGGLGLGLAIARAVVELHEGRIWAESPAAADGRGAVFHVILPTDAKPSGQYASIPGGTKERAVVQSSG